MIRFLGRWWRRLGRYPRIVSHQDWTQLRNQLPREQRKNDMGRNQVRSLVGSLRREKFFHHEKIRECDQLKALLRAESPVAYERWIDERRANPVSPPPKVSVIDEGHLAEYCQPGHGATTCRYLGVGPGGWTCLKLTSFKMLLDARVTAGTISARGDNCAGRLE